MKYAEWIPDKLKGKEVHIVGSGPSLEHFDYGRLDGKNLIAINHAYKLLKDELWTVSIDRGFVEHEDARAPYNTTLVSRKQAPHPIIYWDTKKTFSMKPEEGLYTFKNSGIAAIMTALHAGASKIYLYGFDYKYKDGKSHATKGKFKHQRTGPEYEETYGKRIEGFEVFPRHMIVNMNPNSAIPYFQKIHGY